MSQPYQTTAADRIAAVLLRLFAVFTILMAVFFITDPINAMKDEADMIHMVMMMMSAIKLVLITMFATMIIGIPLHFKKINFWWRSKPMLQLSGLLIGLIIMYVSGLPQFSIKTSFAIDGVHPQIIDLVNENISLPGWGITGFFLMHLYPSAIVNFFRRKPKSGNLDIW